MKELEAIEFTEKYGDQLWHRLKSTLGRKPTQYEYDNFIDKEYNEYLDTLK